MTLAVIRTKVTSDLTTADFQRALRDALEASAEAFAQRVVPKHFTESGAAEYAFATRDPGYQRRKLRRLGHVLPLVSTGRTRSAVRSATVRRLGHVAAEVVLSVPVYITTNPARRAELEATSSRDRRFVASVVDRVLTEKLEE